jgi:predicted short-subunit dehydrogenase-like oxidoreductase (DUF2520 family)
MKVAIIGSGNVATVLGRLIRRNKHEVIQVISRNDQSGKKLAEELNANYSNDFQKPDVQAEIFIISVSDTAINDCIPQIISSDKIIVHTSGAVSKDILKHRADNYGILYPLQSIRKENNHIPAIPFLIDANNDDAMKLIQQLATSISDSVKIAGDDERLKLHVSAVFVNNFTNHLYALTENFCKKEGLDFSLLKPIIKETAERIVDHSPASMQTGPAARKDVLTMEKHLKLLINYPHLRELYLNLSESIMENKS